VVQLDALLADLAAESDALDSLVGPLPTERWQTPTPAEGWTVAHQIAHLAWTDRVAQLAVCDPDRFAEIVQGAIQDPLGYVDRGAAEGAARPSAELLADWRRGRAELANALRELPAGTKLNWFGPPMSAASMATARLMETWAHGQDVADALGVRREPTRRLRHVAHLAVRTRDFAYLLNDRVPPAAGFRVELTGPDHDTWTWGPEGAEQLVTGSALDFCLLATQRRHRDDTDVRAVGAEAEEWLGIIQAFAGMPGSGRTKGQFG
jgi:uncharacterized protein (TIGR03084 family)